MVLVPVQERLDAYVGQPPDELFYLHAKLEPFAGTSGLNLPNAVQRVDPTSLARVPMCLESRRPDRLVSWYSSHVRTVQYMFHHVFACVEAGVLSARFWVSRR